MWHCLYILLYKDFRILQNGLAHRSSHKNRGGDKHIIANLHFAYHRTVDANPYAIAHDGCPLPFSTIFLTYHHTFVDVAVIAYHSFWINGYAIRMTYVKALAYLRLVAYFQSIDFLYIRSISLLTRLERISIVPFALLKWNKKNIHNFYLLY